MTFSGQVFQGKEATMGLRRRNWYQIPLNCLRPSCYKPERALYGIKLSPHCLVNWGAVGWLLPAVGSPTVLSLLLTGAPTTLHLS